MLLMMLSALGKHKRINAIYRWAEYTVCASKNRYLPLFLAYKPYETWKTHSFNSEQISGNAIATTIELV